MPFRPIFGMGKRIFRDALRARFLLSISLRGECRPWRRKKRSEIAASQRRSSLSLSTSDMSAAACSPHTRLKTPQRDEAVSHRSTMQAGAA
jgi:hypothetical protein